MEQQRQSEVAATRQRYEEALSRQLSFVEGLIQDKEKLTAHGQALTAQLAEVRGRSCPPVCTVLYSSGCLCTCVQTRQKHTEERSKAEERFKSTLAQQRQLWQTQGRRTESLHTRLTVECVLCREGEA